MGVAFTLQGGSGGDASIGGKGGLGALVQGTACVTPGEELRVAAGAAGIGTSGGWALGGYFGGSPGTPGWNHDYEPVTGGGGGGASVIMLPAGTLLAVAAGGGGAGGPAYLGSSHTSTPHGGDGGAAGGTPEPGHTGSTAGGVGEHGGAGGAAAVGALGNSGAPGAAAIAEAGQVWGQGGGGGGGIAGGAGGSAADVSEANASGGGGGGAGSSYLDGLLFNASLSTAGSSGDGSAELSWIMSNDVTTFQAVPLSTTIASDTPHLLSATVTNVDGFSCSAPTSLVAWSSSEASDQITGTEIVMTKMGERTITATWAGARVSRAAFL